MATNLEKVRIRDSLEEQYNNNPCGWNLSSLRVAMLPPYHRLEKNSVTFSSTHLILLLQGLQNLFRAESLVVEYRDGSDVDDTTGSDTVLARCTSLEGVTFVVQVWNNNHNHMNHHTNHPPEYVLEIQRTGGDTTLFYQHQYAKRIRQLAMALETTTDYTRPAKVLPIDDPLDFSLVELQEDQKVTDLMVKMMMTHGDRCSTTVVENHVPSAVAIAAKLLSSPQRFDHITMGLESLLSLTDPNKSGLAVAQQAATILLVELKEPQLASLTDTIAYMAFSGRPTLPDAPVAHYNASTALRIVAQAFQLVPPDVLVAFYHRTAARYPALFPSTLWSNVQNAKSAPHAAYVSTQILVALGRVGLLPLFLASSDAVQHASVVGSRCHAALELASQRLLRVVQGSG